MEGFDSQTVNFETFFTTRFFDCINSSPIYDFYYYYTERYELSEMPDPLNKFSKNIDISPFYYVYKESNIKWISEHIFNIKYNRITDFKKFHETYSGDVYPYFYKVYYYVPYRMGGDSGPIVKNISNRELLDDGRYKITIDLHNESSGEKYKYEMIIGLKSIDGKHYWFLYSYKKAK